MWLHRRALPHAWGAVMRALPGYGPRGCQLLPVRTHRPPQATGAPTGRGSYVTRPGMRRLPQAEWVSVARGMHGWLRRPSESENQNAPSPPSPAAQEPDNRTGPGKGKKLASAGDPADGT